MSQISLTWNPYLPPSHLLAAHRPMGSISAQAWGFTSFFELCYAGVCLQPCLGYWALHHSFISCGFCKGWACLGLLQVLSLTQPLWVNAPWYSHSLWRHLLGPCLNPPSFWWAASLCCSLPSNARFKRSTISDAMHNYSAGCLHPLSKRIGGLLSLDRWTVEKWVNTKDPERGKTSKACNAQVLMVLN